MRKPTFSPDLPEGVTFPEFSAHPELGLSRAGRGIEEPAPDADEPDITFTPVPRLRARRNGWTDDRQRAFIAALARCGSVSAAARHVGMTARTAYKLLDCPGAESFAAAWDAAIDMGFAKVQIDALDRALHGSFVPVYRRGKLAKVEHRRNDRLAIALLGGKDKRIDAFRASALSRCQHRADLRELDFLRDERAARLAEIEEEYRASVERLMGDVHDRIEQRAAAGPRIVAL